MSDNVDLIALAHRYLAAIERGAIGDELAVFFTADVIQEELPNQLSPQTVRRDLTAILESAAHGQRVLRRQHYEVRHAVRDGDTVALEVSWTGTLAIPLGKLAAGAELRAGFAVFLEFRDGRIHRQRNYDCFEPW